ncbi:MAG: FG-GAP repeat domain-containing protein [Planctomycetota bacterium]
MRPVLGRALVLGAAILLAGQAVGAQQYFLELDDSHLPLTFSAPALSVAGDIDGDGDLDVASSSFRNKNYTPPRGRELLLSLNDGTGVFVDVSSRLPGLVGDQGYPVFFDMDGDADLDLAVGLFKTTGTKRLRLFVNDGKGNFTDASNNISGVPISSMALAYGDVDADGDLDLVVVGGTAQLFLNDGKGRFTDATSRLPGGSFSGSSVVLFDIDRDKDLDMFIGDSPSRGIARNRLYLNDGRGTYTTAAVSRLPPTVKPTKHAIAADINGDGSRDLVGVFGYFDATPKYVNEPFLWMNNGKGVFVDVSPGRIDGKDDWISRIAASDVDGDGDVDLLWTNSLTDKGDLGAVRLLLNDGKGAFTWSANGPAGLPGGEPLVADFDGDKRPDLLLSGYPGALYLRDGRGSWINSARRKLPPKADRTAEIVRSADLDQDGTVDLILGQGRYGNSGRGLWAPPVSLLLGDSAGRFSNAPPGQFPGRPVAATGIAIADVDGDKDLDVACSSFKRSGASLSARTRLFANDGKGKFSETTTAALPNDDVPKSDLVLGDVDGDKDVDVLLGCSFINTLVGQSVFPNRLFLNDGKGLFRDVSSTHLPTKAYNTTTLAMGDVDGDGDPDFVEGNARYRPHWRFGWYPGPNVLYTNDGKGLFTLSQSAIPPHNEETTQVLLADFDRDGDLDLFVANLAQQNRLYLNNGKGVFSDGTATRLPTGLDSSTSAAKGDVDGDGDIDIIVHGWHSKGIGSRLPYVLVNDGKGFFKDVGIWMPDTFPFKLHLFDADGDQDLDLAIDGLILENTTRHLATVHPPRIGRPLTYVLYAGPGRAKRSQSALLFIELGPAVTPVPVPPFGRFGLDLTRMLPVGLVPIPAPNGTGTHSIPVPGVSGLVGVRLGSQALVLHSSQIRDWRLTNMLSQRVR